jgi:pyruvate/2-oxoglutarate dehydrogenase complex dihydrolipoamide dehydrogenase (E3) component
MELEATIEEVKHMTHPHPATSESIWDAALMLYQTYKQNK